MDKVGFFQVAILEGSISEIAGVERGEIKVAVVEIASKCVDTTEVGVDDDGSGKITIYHFAARKYCITAEDIVEGAVLEQTKIEEGVQQCCVGKIYIAEGTPCKIGCDQFLLG